MKKYTLAAFVVSLTLVATSFAETSYTAPSNRVATIEARCDDARPEVRRTFNVYPADEVYFGDRI